MAELYESLVRECLELNHGYFVRTDLKYHTDVGGISDVDIIAIHPRKNEMIIGEVKSGSWNDKEIIEFFKEKFGKNSEGLDKILKEINIDPSNRKIRFVFYCWPFFTKEKREEIKTNLPKNIDVVFFNQIIQEIIDSYSKKENFEYLPDFPYSMLIQMIESIYNRVKPQLKFERKNV